jgi:hypothetical protein
MRVCRYPSKNNQEAFNYIIDGQIMDMPAQCPKELYVCMLLPTMHVCHCVLLQV